jgi:hypothetical protein
MYHKFNVIRNFFLHNTLFKWSKHSCMPASAFVCQAIIVSAGRGENTSCRIMSRFQKPGWEGCTRLSWRLLPLVKRCSQQEWVRVTLCKGDAPICDCAPPCWEPSKSAAQLVIFASSRAVMAIGSQNKAAVRIFAKAVIPWRQRLNKRVPHWNHGNDIPGGGEIIAGLPPTHAHRKCNQFLFHYDTTSLHASLPCLI